MTHTATIPSHAELLVVGAGPGGYAAAFRAAELGLNVTLVDPEANPGGVCLHRGCIPSKALLHVATLIDETRDAAAIGLTFAPPAIDLDRVRAWRDEVVGTLTGGLGKKVERQKVTYVRGRATLLSPNHVAIETVDGARGELRFEQCILATGSRPTLLPGVEISERVMDSTGALALDTVPDSLLVIGGGYIGLELGSVYAALGSSVSVVEMASGLLPGADRDLVSVLKRSLGKRFEAIHLATKVTGLEVHPDGVAVSLEGRDGVVREARYERVLMAIGRRPNTGSLGLEHTRLELDEGGFVQVDGQRRTAESHIFAIGDMAGEPMLAHKAYAEAHVAAEAAAGQKALYDPRAIPAVVYTNPEIAWCGLTELEARAQGRAVKTAKLPWRSNGRMLTLGHDQGMTKLIVDPETERLLGMAVVGPGAGELIAEGVLALEMAAVVGDLRGTIHPHPTLSETVWEAAQQL